ncbi:MAG: DUF1214 domain-containing protein [Prevotella sp.]|jgi:hypothetical protein|nr:DUF1214 domain-containing protein [Prevotella sp.]
MKKKLYLPLLLATLLAGVFATSCKQPAPEPTAKEVEDAYIYTLARYLVIQQENTDINVDKTEYNKIKYNSLVSATFVNPNMDVVYLEAWIAVDETHAVVLNIPEIKNRYYTAQILDQWAQVTVNINNRTMPQTPYGKFAFVLKGSTAAIPEGATKVEVMSPKSKLLARIELQNTPDEAVKLEHAFTLDVPEGIKVDKPIEIPAFTNINLIDVAIFDKLDEVFASCPDQMEKAPEYQAMAKKVAAYINDKPENRTKINEIVKNQAIPAFMKGAHGFGTQKGGWSVSYGIGDYTKNNDIFVRSVANYGGLWANVASEALYFMGLTDANKELLNGDNVYEIRFSKDQLPQNQVDAFWSVTLYSTPDYHLVENPLKRYNLNNHSKLKMNKDGSMSIWVSAEQPKDVPQENWLPSAKGKGFALTFRMYASKKSVLDGTWFVAPIKKQTVTGKK